METEYILSFPIANIRPIVRSTKLEEIIQFVCDQNSIVVATTKFWNRQFLFLFQAVHSQNSIFFCYSVINIA